MDMASLLYLPRVSARTIVTRLAPPFPIDLPALGRIGSGCRPSGVFSCNGEVSAELAGKNATNRAYNR